MGLDLAHYWSKLTHYWKGNHPVDNRQMVNIPLVIFHQLYQRQIWCKTKRSKFSAALRRLSSGQTQSVPPPLPPRLSLGQLTSLPAGQPRMPSSQQRQGGETHPRLARLSLSHQPSLPRILSQSSVHHGEPSIIYGNGSHDSLLVILWLGGGTYVDVARWQGGWYLFILVSSALVQEGFKFFESLEQICSIKSWKKCVKHSKHVQLGLQVYKSVTIQGDGLHPLCLLEPSTTDLHWHQHNSCTCKCKLTK